MNSTLEVFMSYKTAEINTFCYTTLCTRSLLKHPICAKWRIFSKHTIRSTLKLIGLDFLIKQISCLKIFKSVHSCRSYLTISEIGTMPAKKFWPSLSVNSKKKKKL
jgi:hypothetical protein